ncbi:MAG: right-handed parallel beta-helix repeat-containing protein [Puniceicoccaceae bacterium]|nr:MAG: right-handed parallel beta-helix repeat-containing protein [Puniceicoccaceae bacterium]
MFRFPPILCSGFLAAASLATPLGLHAQREADVTRSGNTWTVTITNLASGGSGVAHTGNDMILAIQAAANALTQGRTAKETVHIRSSGATGTHSWNGDVKGINIPSYTILDFHGNTILVNDTPGDELIVPIRPRRVSHIEVRNLRILGNPRYGMWFFGCTDVLLSNIQISIPEATNIGLGIRFEDRNGVWNRDVHLEDITVENTRHHGVEFWRTDGLTVENLVTRNTGGAGLLLNLTRNAHVKRIDAFRANFGGGYAGFRTANNAGPNIVVDKVIARECGRGVFTVSGSHGITIHEVDISGSSSHGMLIEDTQDMVVNGGTIADCGAEGIRITSRQLGQGPGPDHHPARNITVRNLTITGCSFGIRETLPRTSHNFILNNDLRDNNTCLVSQGPGTIVSGNLCNGVRQNDSWLAWLDRTYPGATPATADPTADPHQRGLPKLLRYALDLGPEAGPADLPRPEIMDHHLGLSFPRDPLRNDLALIVEATSDPADWGEILYDSRTDAVPADEHGLIRILDTHSLDSSEDRRFLRLRAELLD